MQLSKQKEGTQSPQLNNAAVGQRGDSFGGMDSWDTGGCQIVQCVTAFQGSCVVDFDTEAYSMMHVRPGGLISIGLSGLCQDVLIAYTS